MRIVVITLESLFEGEAQALNRLFAAGMPLLHLRKPGAEQQELHDLLTEIQPAYYGRIVLHDCFDLLEVFPLKGVHLNRRNPVFDSGREVAVSRSCHSLEEIGQGVDNYEYVFLSPLFDSLSKSGYRQAFRPEELEEAHRLGHINDRVVALGGITPERFPQVRAYGFGGVAMLGALWSDFLHDQDEAALLRRWECIQTNASKT